MNFQIRKSPHREGLGYKCGHHWIELFKVHHLVCKETLKDPESAGTDLFPLLVYRL